jgi:hypothetical protein
MNISPLRRAGTTSLLALAAPHAHAFSCQNLLAHIKGDGSVVAGTRDGGVAAATGGKRLRIGWKLGTPEHTRE